MSNVLSNSVLWTGRGGSSRTQRSPFGDQIAAAPDHVLVMELLKRGYAVARMPPEQLLEELSA